MIIVCQNHRPFFSLATSFLHVISVTHTNLSTILHWLKKHDYTCTHVPITARHYNRAHHKKAKRTILPYHTGHVSYFIPFLIYKLKKMIIAAHVLRSSPALKYFQSQTAPRPTAVCSHYHPPESIYPRRVAPRLRRCRPRRYPLFFHRRRPLRSLSRPPAPRPLDPRLLLRPRQHRPRCSPRWRASAPLKPRALHRCARFLSNSDQMGCLCCVPPPTHLSCPPSVECSPRC